MPAAVAYGILACALAAMLSGLLVLAGWLLDLPALTRLASGRRPVDALSALSFLVAGLALALSLRHPTRRAARVLAIVLSLSGGMVLLQGILNLDLEVDLFFFLSDPRAGTMPLLSALNVLLLGVGLVLMEVEYRRIRPSEILAVLLGLVSLFCLVDHVLDAPRMPLASALTFLALGLGVFVSRPGLGWLRAVREDSEVRAMALARIVWLISIMLVLAGGAWLYQVQERQNRADTERNLKANAQFTADQIVRWRMERLNDAAMLMTLADPASPWMGNISQSSPAGLVSFRAMFRSWQTYWRCQNIFLVDVRGRVRASLQNNQEALPKEVLPELARALLLRQPLLTDLLLPEGRTQPILMVIAPLLDRAVDEAPGIGALLVEYQAADSLDPLLHAQPIPSASGENLLIREGPGIALCLNELRLQTNTALQLAIPLSEKTQPAAQVVQGRRGIWYGDDHRGVPVIACLNSLPDSPWFLVSQQDLAEARQSWRLRASLIWIMLGTLILADTFLLALSGQQRKRVQALTLLEETQRANSQYTRSLIEASLDPLAAIRADGIITDGNESLIEATGVDRDQLIGTDFSTYFTEPEQARAVYERVFAEGAVRDYPLELRHLSGRVTHVLYNASVYYDINGEVAGVLAVARDVTEQRKAEALIRQMNAELEDRVRQRTAELEAVNQELARSNADLDQFAYVASHDLQEPLRGVSGCVELLVNRNRKLLDERSQEIAQHAVDGAARMQRLIEDLLAYSRVGTRGGTAVLVDTGQTVREALLNLESAVRESGATIDAVDLPTVPADPTQLRQLFQNLLGNAIKFRSDRPLRLEIKARPVEARWEFSVRDNGIGIEKDYFDRIFVIFQRLHSRDEYPGTGIGLAICKKIVERHGGRIWVESEPGQGTTFFFTLPAVQGAKA